MHSSCLFQSQRTNYFNPCSSHVLLFSDGHQDVKKLSSHRQWNGCWHQQTVWQDGGLCYNRNINPIIFVSYTNVQDVEEGEAVNKDLCFCLCGCLYLMMQHVGHRRITARFRDPARARAAGIIDGWNYLLLAWLTDVSGWPNNHSSRSHVKILFVASVTWLTRATPRMAY